MKKIAILLAVVVSAAIFFAGCANLGVEPVAISKYPAGFPQTVSEVGRIYDSLPSTLQLAPRGYTEVGYQGAVAIDIGGSDSSKNPNSIVFSLCTASVKTHCIEKKTVYAETASTVYGVKAYYGNYRLENPNDPYQSYEFPIVFILGGYDGEGVAQVRNLYIRGVLVPGVRPCAIKTFSSWPHPSLILENWPPMHSGLTNSSYQIFDLVTKEIFDYGRD